MILIKPSFEIIEQESGFEGVLKQIEKVGRTCYKSEDRIKEGSAKKFVDMLTTNCHGAMLEHGTVYLFMRYNSNQEGNCYIWDDRTDRHYDPDVVKYNNAYSKVQYDDNYNAYITTNYRVLIENNWLDDLQFQCEPTEYHAKRVTVKFTCDRGVSHEFVRHRVFSFAQESTRYCNYSKAKFGNELTFIEPCWEMKELDRNIFNGFLQCAESTYIGLTTMGWKPQEARAVLPNSLKTELVMTGFIDDWKHFFELRCDSAAHPQARELAIPLQDWFKENNLID